MNLIITRIAPFPWSTRCCLRYCGGSPPLKAFFHSSITQKMASPAILAAKAALASVDLKGYDPEQSKLMDERCILVDEEDNAIGAVDKKTCELPWFCDGIGLDRVSFLSGHLMENINKGL